MSTVLTVLPFLEETVQALEKVPHLVHKTHTQTGKEQKACGMREYPGVAQALSLEVHRKEQSYGL